MRARLFAACALWGTLLVFGGLARADGDKSIQSASDIGPAEQKYKEGLALLRAGKAKEALEPLEASRKLAPSPNTDLLIGHALRELGRRVEAIQTYERVVAAAGDRVRAGQERYRATLEDAGRFEAILQSELARLHVVVVHAHGAATARIDGAEVALEPGPPGTLTATAWHEPGGASIEVMQSGAPARVASMSLVAGQRSEATIDLDEIGAPSKGPPVAAWIAGGAGVAGLVVFAAFGAAALSEKHDLEACSPRCAPSQYQDEADRGQLHQTVANIGLVAGIGGIATGVIIWAAAARSTHTPKSAVRMMPIDFGVGPRLLVIRGSF